MALIYHLITGIITLFAVAQTSDGKLFIAKLRQESSPKDSTCLCDTLRWGAYLACSVALWLVAWPLIVMSWAVARIVKPAQTEEN